MIDPGEELLLIVAFGFNREGSQTPRPRNDDVVRMRFVDDDRKTCVHLRSLAERIVITRTDGPGIGLSNRLMREDWEAEIRDSPTLLRLYAKNAICKEEAHMEGVIANFTMDLPSRVRTLLRSIVSSYYEVKEDGWNPLPIKLSVSEISRIVAANRSSVSLVFFDWMQKEWARRDGRRIIISGRLLTQVYDLVDRIPPDDASVSDPF